MKDTRSNWIATAIVLLAAALRFARLDWVEFKYDEAIIAQLALGLARHGRVPLWGIIASFGIPNGALAEWLLAIPYRISCDPSVAAGFVAGMNVLAVVMTYRFTRKLAGPWAAAVAALLFAVSPWAVIYGRKTWAHPSLIPPFAVAYMWTANAAFIQKRPWWFLAHMLALAACVSLSYSALALVVVSLLYMVIFWWRKWPWRVLLAAAAMVGAGLALLFALDARLSGLPMRAAPGRAWDMAQRVAQVSMTGRARIDESAAQLAWMMVTGVNLHSLAGPQEFRNYLASILPVAPLYTALGALIVVAIIGAYYRAARCRYDAEARSGLLMALAASVPVLLFLRHSTPLQLHYFMQLYPWPFVLLAVLISWMAEQHPRWRIRAWSGVLLGIIAAAQVYGYVTIMRFVTERATPGAYGTPVGLTMRAVRAAEDMARAIGGSILIVGDGDSIEYDEMPAMWEVMASPAFAPRPVDRRQAMVYPAGPTVIVYAPGAEHAQEGDLPIRLLDKVESLVALRPGEGDYRLVRWTGQPVPTMGGLSMRGPNRWANGVQLRAARALGDARPGGTLRWQLTWSVEAAPPPGADYHWFNHLIDAQGRRVGQKDGVGFPSRHWRIGDTVVMWFDIPLAADVPAGRYAMRVGIYTFPDVRNVPLLDASGNSVADAVELGPIEIR